METTDLEQKIPEPDDNAEQQQDEPEQVDEPDEGSGQDEVSEPPEPPKTEDGDEVEEAPRQDEEDIDDEEEEDDEDDVKVTIDDEAPDYNLRAKQRQPQQAKTVATIDLDAQQPILDVDLNTIEDKPWRKPGADISDYFNYGFDEDTWKLYCEKQKKMKQTVNELASNSETTFKIPVMPTNEHSKYSPVRMIPTIISNNEPRFTAWIPPMTTPGPSGSPIGKHGERAERHPDRGEKSRSEKSRSERSEKSSRDHKSRDRSDRSSHPVEKHSERTEKHSDRSERSGKSSRDHKTRDRDRSERSSHRSETSSSRKRQRSTERDREKKRKRSR